MSDGAPVVLTADRTLMAAYDVLLDGMMAASQTTTTPAPIMNRLLLPPAPHPGGRALLAPLGLRRVEAALLEGGLARDDVVVVDDAHLAQVVGPATRVVAISSGEPTGIGMSSTTMAGVAGGRIYPEVEFRRLLGSALALRDARAPEAKVVVGGPGAWQLVKDDRARRQVGVDHVVLGYAEGNAARLFTTLMEGGEMPPVVQGEGVAADAIPRLRGATAMGVVEISRGCGLGCEFCTIARVPMQHLPPEAILADVQINLAAGMTSVAILSEDCFRYGGQGVHCSPEALLDLLEQIRQLPGVRLIQVDHANISSVAAYEDPELHTLRDLLAGEQTGRRPWVNLGVETASGELLAANGGAAKLGPTGPDGWGEFCAEQVRRLCAAGFMPMVSLIAGLPGETPVHVEETLRWVRGLQHLPLTIFPVIHAPLEEGQERRQRILQGLTKAHWQLMRQCYELNFRWVPRMYWDDQTGAGTGLPRRLALQLLGKGQVVLWRSRLRRLEARAPV